MQNPQRQALFESVPIPKAVATLAVPTILSSLVMILYNLADTYFVGMLNNPIENAAVTLAAPVLLAFNAVNNLFGVGLPASIQNLLNVTGMTILNNFTSSFGANAVAAMGIAQKINQVPFYIVLGSSQGIMPLVSYTYSSRRIDRMKRTILFTLRTALCVMVAVTIFYSFAADSLIRLFMDNPEIIEYGTRFLRGMCLAIPFLCIDFIAVGVFQAVGMGREALIFAILRKIVLEIPALFILNWLFPLYGLAYAQMCAEIVLSVAAVFVLTRLFRRLKASSAPIL